MNFKAQLPKPGKKVKYGFELIQQKDFTFFSIRPDYQKFKSKVYNSEEDCVSVLVGTSFPNSFYRACEERIALLIKESKLKKKENFCLELDDRNFHEVRDIHGFFLELKQTLRIGEATREIGTVVEYNKPDNVTTDGDLFDGDKCFHSLSFLNWMQENGYTIPEELLFQKNKAGQFEYKDSIIFGDLKQTFPGHPMNKEIEKDPLYIAVQTRQDLLDGKILKNKNLNRKQQITNWLRKKYDSDILSNEQIKHIFALINDNARGNR